MSIAANVAAPATSAPIIPTAPKPVAKRKAVTAKVNAAAAAIAELLTPAPNAHAEKAPTKVEPRVDQALVDSYLKAEAGVGDAAVALLYACLHAKVHPSQFGTNGSAKVRASEFNTAYKAMRLLTLKSAKAVMDDAAKRPGERRSNIVKALREAIAVGASVKGSALKSAALAKEVGARMAERDATKAAEKLTRAPRPAQLPKSNSPKAVMPAVLAAFVDAEKTLSKGEWAGNQGGKAKDLMDALAEVIRCAEALA